MPTLSLSKNQGSRAGIRDIYHIALGGLDGLFPFTGSVEYILHVLHFPPRLHAGPACARAPVLSQYWTLATSVADSY